MRLHEYFRSSTSVRVRVALNLKGIDYEHVGYPLREGAQRAPPYLDMNPQGLVPSLELDDGTVLTQSLAIVEWLDESYPEPPLLPGDALGRARVRSLAQLVALDIHPLNNLRVLERVRDAYGQHDAGVAEWFRHWAGDGFAALERRLVAEPATGAFCHGDAPSLADVCLYAQVLNNRRFDVPVEPFPTVMGVFERCAALDAFANAAPELQPDATA